MPINQITSMIRGAAGRFKRRATEAEQHMNTDSAGKVTAGRREDIWGNESVGMSYQNYQPNDNPILLRMQGELGYRFPTGVFFDGIDKDRQVNAAYGQRIDALLAKKRKIVPADDTDRAQFAAKFIEQALFHQIDARDGDTGLAQDIADWMWAFPVGFAVSEKVPAEKTFAVDGKSREWLIYSKFVSLHQRRFVYDWDGLPRLLTKEHRKEGVAVSPWQFCIFRPFTRHENPYGWGEMTSLFWCVFFKRKVEKWQLGHAERFGSPSIVTKTDVNRTILPSERDELQAHMNAWQYETGLIPPSGVEIMLLQAADAGETYEKIISRLDREIATIILGQPQTLGQGEVAGRGFSEMFEAVAASKTASDARAVEAFVNGSIISELMALNLPDYPMPVFSIVTEPAKDLGYEVVIDQGLAAMGFPLSISDLSDRYGRPIATEDEDNLQALLQKQQMEVAEQQSKLDMRAASDKVVNNKAKSTTSQTGGAKSALQAKRDRKEQ